MRALYVCIQTPSPLASNGGGQAAFDYLTTLSRLCEVDLVTSVVPGTEEWLEPLEGLVHELFAVPWNPSLGGRAFGYASSALKSGRLSPLLNRPFLDTAEKRSASGDYDVVQADWTEIARHVRAPAGTPFLCGAHDVRSEVAERSWRAARGPVGRQLARWRWRRDRREEEQLFRRATAVLTMSDADARRVRELAPETPAHPVVYRQARPDVDPPPWSEREPETLLYVGDYGREPNRRIALRILDDVLPELKRRRPAVELVLAGGRMPEELAAHARSRGASLSGYQPCLDDVYRRSTLLFAPIEIGGGVHVEIIEALAHGLPVLTTAVGNDGVGAEAGRAVWVADTPSAMIEGCDHLLGHPEEAARLGAAGRAHAVARFGPEPALRALEGVLRSVRPAG